MVIPFSFIKGSGSLPGTAIGNIFSDTFNRVGLGSNWTTTGGTFNCDGSGDVLVSGGAGTYVNYTRYSAWATCLEEHSITTTFQVTSVPGATTYGIGFGVRGINSNDSRSYVVSLDCSTSVNRGKLNILASSNAGATTFNLGTYSSAVTITNGHEYSLTITRSYNVITATVTNLTDATTATATRTFSYTYASPVYVANATGNVCIWALGGTQKVHSISYDSTALKNVDTMIVGDSITYGIFSGGLSARWATEVFSSSTKSKNISGGASDKTAEFLAKINELILINPRKAVLMIGGNDVFFGVAAATRNANYLSAVNQLKAAGITVVHCYASPRDATDMSAWNSHILSTYGGTDTVIQTTFSNLTTTPGTTTDLAAAYDSGDGTHPNAAGHTAIANAVRTNI